MEKPPENLSLLEQHLFQQNQRLIEVSGRLKKFCDDANNAIYDAEEKSEEKIDRTVSLIIRTDIRR